MLNMQQGASPKKEARLWRRDLKNQKVDSLAFNHYYSFFNGIGQKKVLANRHDGC